MSVNVILTLKQLLMPQKLLSQKLLPEMPQLCITTVLKEKIPKVFTQELLLSLILINKTMVTAITSEIFQTDPTKLNSPKQPNHVTTNNACLKSEPPSTPTPMLISKPLSKPSKNAFTKVFSTPCLMLKETTKLN